MDEPETPSDDALPAFYITKVVADVSEYHVLLYDNDDADDHPIGMLTIDETRPLTAEDLEQAKLSLVRIALDWVCEAPLEAPLAGVGGRSAVLYYIGNNGHAQSQLMIRSGYTDDDGRL